MTKKNEFKRVGRYTVYAKDHFKPHCQTGKRANVIGPVPGQSTFNGLIRSTSRINKRFCAECREGCGEMMRMVVVYEQYMSLMWRDLRGPLPLR